MQKLLYILLTLFVCCNIITNSQCPFNTSVSKISPTCGDNGTINVNVTNSPKGATFYLYKSSTFVTEVYGLGLNVNNLTAGVYRVIIRDSATGCIDSVINISLDTNSNSMQVIYSVDSIKCINGSDGKIKLTVLRGIGPFTYQWEYSASNMSDSATNLSKGIYKVRVIDANGCKIDRSIDLTYRQSRLKLKKVEVLNSDCKKPIGRINVEVEGGLPPYSYVWTNTTKQDMPLDSLEKGKFTVFFTDSLKCDTVWVRDIEVKENLGPKGVLVGSDTICPNGELGHLSVMITEGDSNSIKVEWYHDVTTSRHLTGLGVGDYEVYLVDRALCRDTIKKSIEMFDERKVTLTGNRNMVVGQTTEIKIDNKEGLSNIIWTPAELCISSNEGARVTPRSSTDNLIKMTANYERGCVVTAFFPFVVSQEIVDIDVPDYFSPNGDATNEFYKLKLNETIGIENFSFKIFDKWGNEVYNAATPDFSWDGKSYEGKELTSGTYRYVMRYGTASNKFEPKVQTGQILLVK